MCVTHAIGYLYSLIVISIAVLHNSGSVNCAGPVCYSCTNMPNPRDCNRIQQCGSGEACMVKFFVTASGNSFFNSGCISTSACNSIKTPVARGYDVIVEESVVEQRYHGHVVEQRDHAHMVEKREDVPVCFECCKNNDYCNRGLCTAPDPPSNRTTCLECPDVVRPDACEYVAQCDPGQICYTEFLKLNGQDRYRLGCIEKNACSDPIPLIGKKRFLDSLQKYCNKCCRSGHGNCNRELCHADGHVPPGVDVMTLVNPPLRADLCRDLKERSCKLLGFEDPDFCLSPSIANYACREYCGTCVNPGHVTPAPGAGVLPPTDCFYDSKKYQGAYTFTTDGTPCISWKQIVSAGYQFADGLPDADLNVTGSKCRDPDGRGHPWCFTSMSLQWGFCNVPFCEECYYKGNMSQYNGHVAKNNMNETCEFWIDNTVPPLYDTSFPDKTISDAHNYCRDPFNFQIATCYANGKITECNIPQCPTPCEDSKNTDCNIVKEYICGNEYLSKTLCPKTCNVCGFGLLPAVIVSPPADTCVDNPDASCMVLKDIICNNPDGAAKYCPKTCNKCFVQFKQSTTVLTTSVSILTTSLASSTVEMSTSSVGPPTWLHWSTWECKYNNGQCYSIKNRNCSTGLSSDCDGLPYKIQVCNDTFCPQNTTTVPTTVTASKCQDDPTYSCNNSDVSLLVCQEESLAKFCNKTCGRCGSCTDYFNCSSKNTQDLFCSDDNLARMYCRNTCGRCNEPLLQVNLNSCGDPAANDNQCASLHKEICLCNDPDINMLCPNYCNGKCAGASVIDKTCTVSKSRRSVDGFTDQLWRMAKRVAEYFDSR